MPKHSCAYFLTGDAALGLINLSLSGLSFTILKQGCSSKRKTTNDFFKYYQSIQKNYEGFFLEFPLTGMADEGGSALKCKSKFRL